MSIFDLDALKDILALDEPESQQQFKPVRVYDFKHPDKFSKEQLRTLQMLHETFGRLLATGFSGLFRTVANIEIASVSQMSYEDVVEALANPSVLGVFDIASLGNVLVELRPEMAFPMIDRLFGGPGAKFSGARGLTDLELPVVRRIFLRFFEPFEQAWANVCENPRVTLENVHTNPLFTQLAAPNEVVIRIMFLVEMFGLTGEMSICIPYLALEPISSKLSARHWYAKETSRQAEDKDYSPQISSLLDDAEVELRVQLGNALVSLGELLELEEGDVIELSRRVSEPSKVLIGGVQKFKAYPGLRGKRVSIKISDVLRKDGDSYGR